MKSRVDPFGFPNNELLKTEYTNPDLATNDAMDGMMIFNCGFILKCHTMPCHTSYCLTLSSNMRYGRTIYFSSRDRPICWLWNNDRKIKAITARKC